LIVKYEQFLVGQVQQTTACNIHVVSKADVHQARA